MRRTTKWLRKAQGAATTEKLLVILFAIVLVGGAVMVFGPTLAAKYAIVGKILGGGEQKVATLADPTYVREGPNPIWYVLFTFGAAGFFGAFVAPLLFPRARHTRREILVGAVDRFPFLAPLINREALLEANMDELRGLRDEVNALHKHREGALEIQPHDFGKMALPSEQTVDASFAEMLDIDEIVEAAEAGRKPVRKKARRPSMESGTETVDAEPLPVRMARLKGDDGIPFDELDPSLKPQLQGISRPAPGDDSTTIDAKREDVADETLMADVADPDLLAEVGEDLDRTMIHDSQPLKPAFPAGPEEETAAVKSLKERLRDRENSGTIPKSRRSGPLRADSGSMRRPPSRPIPLDATTQDDHRPASALDSTTKDYDTYE